MKRGLSLLSLALTIGVMLIIAGAIIMSMDKMSDDAQAMVILNEMKILQSKIYEYQLKHEEDSNAYPYFGEIVTEGEYINYYEVSKSELEEMDIINIDNTYLVNYTTQDIVYKQGVSIEGVMCYTINEIDEKVNVLQK